MKSRWEIFEAINYFDIMLTYTYKYYLTLSRKLYL